jgi:hypothetical protein
MWTRNFTMEGRSNMRKPLVLGLVTLGLVAGPGVASAAAAEFGPFSTNGGCLTSAKKAKLNGYAVTSCTYKAYGSYRPGWYYSTYKKKG